MVVQEVLDAISPTYGENWDTVYRGHAVGFWNVAIKSGMRDKDARLLKL